MYLSYYYSYAIQILAGNLNAKCKMQMQMQMQKANVIGSALNPLLQRPCFIFNWMKSNYPTNDIPPNEYK